MTDPLTHWQGVYAHRAQDTVSWYELVPARSLEMIQATGVGKSAPILDVGGGASTLVDHLLADGFTDITVLDITVAALETAKQRLGARAAAVTWLAEDIRFFRPGRQFAVWHDRVAFHFLTDPADQQRYLTSLRGALQGPGGGHVILATFGPDGPTSCSGLPVQRYSAEDLGGLLGPEFVLRDTHLDMHTTPAGSTQQLMYGRWQRVPSEPPLSQVE